MLLNDGLYRREFLVVQEQGEEQQISHRGMERRGVWRHLYARCGDLSVVPCNSQFPARLRIPGIVVVAWHGWKEKTSSGT